MPIAYQYDSGIYRVTCTSCDAREHTPTRGFDEQVARVFRWHSAGRWVSRCRACETAARRQRATSGPRAPRAARAARIVNALRNFGVELELRAPRDVTESHCRDALRNADLTDWRVTYDGSIHGHGYEIVSPVLNGDAGLEAVRKACRALRGIGCTVDSSCGTHVHHEIRDLDMPAIRRLAHTWANNQHLIDGLVSQSRRNSRNQYCEAFTSDDAAHIDSLEDLRRSYLSRYKTLNFAAYARYGTVEVRQHQGTLDAEKIVSWIRFGQALIADAAATSRAQTAHTTVVAFLTGLGEALNDTARTFLLGRAVEFNAAPVM